MPLSSWNSSATASATSDSCPRKSRLHVRARFCSARLLCGYPNPSASRVRFPQVFMLCSALEQPRSDQLATPTFSQAKVHSISIGTTVIRPAGHARSLTCHSRKSSFVLKFAGQRAMLDYWPPADPGVSRRGLVPRQRDTFDCSPPVHPA
jgi:hypothetical protein